MEINQVRCDYCDADITKPTNYRLVLMPVWNEALGEVCAPNHNFCGLGCLAYWCANDFNKFNE